MPTDEREAAVLLAERAYPGLDPSGFCSRHHPSQREYGCTICYPDLRALIDAHNTLKQRAWKALQDIELELSHGPTANFDYIAKRLREGQDTVLGGD